MVNERAQKTLMKHVRSGDFVAIWQLMHEIDGSDVNLQLADGSDPLGWTPAGWAAKFGRNGTIEVMLHYGLDVNAFGNNTDRLLHIAARTNRVLVVQQLLQHGARRDLTNKAGQTFDSVAGPEVQEWLAKAQHGLEHADSHDYALQEQVLCQHDSSWWSAWVTQIDVDQPKVDDLFADPPTPRRYRIHFAGFGSKHEEWAAPVNLAKVTLGNMKSLPLGRVLLPTGQVESDGLGLATPPVSTPTTTATTTDTTTSTTSPANANAATTSDAGPGPSLQKSAVVMTPRNSDTPAVAPGLSQPTDGTSNAEPPAKRARQASNAQGTSEATGTHTQVTPSQVSSSPRKQEFQVVHGIQAPVSGVPYSERGISSQLGFFSSRTVLNDAPLPAVSKLLQHDVQNVVNRGLNSEPAGAEEDVPQSMFSRLAAGPTAAAEANLNLPGIDDRSAALLLRFVDTLVRRQAHAHPDIASNPAHPDSAEVQRATEVAHLRSELALLHSEVEDLTTYCQQLEQRHARWIKTLAGKDETIAALRLETRVLKDEQAASGITTAREYAGTIRRLRTQLALTTVRLGETLTAKSQLQEELDELKLRYAKYNLVQAGLLRTLDGTPSTSSAPTAAPTTVPPSTASNSNPPTTSGEASSLASTSTIAVADATATTPIAPSNPASATEPTGTVALSSPSATQGTTKPEPTAGTTPSAHAQAGGDESTAADLGMEVDTTTTADLPA
ncbi:uncharacterized protein MONBRDRAFT_29031 [Monosiga brevicollis MX1]|uniref:Uncharacterized protein n=1 Tax=Monosiga brevicollis TaxID=81824 RepID=A9V9W9_MONBE|nr:uncharacterized protein MONBRDRAFT_29031 [Monosiga brevicollis MX1]EDQ85560.1 predicted protein [Monosiga brevicollis MX1]|eukprot:XP_001749509.1 hypothetical protein [Monosiga brevicollis MX1]